MANEEKNSIVMEATVLGKLGDRLLVHFPWQPDGEVSTPSQRTMNAIEDTGLKVVNDPKNYLSLSVSSAAE